MPWVYMGEILWPNWGQMSRGLGAWTLNNVHVPFEIICINGPKLCYHKDYAANVAILKGQFLYTYIFFI